MTPARLGEAAHIQPRSIPRNVVATEEGEAPMTRLATSLGTLIALLAVAPSAQAGSYVFSIGGHRFHVEAPRNCRSASCVSISSNRNFRPAGGGRRHDTRSACPTAGCPGAAAGLSGNPGPAATGDCGRAVTGAAAAARARRDDVAARCAAAGAKIRGTKERGPGPQSATG